MTRMQLSGKTLDAEKKRPRGLKPAIMPGHLRGAESAALPRCFTHLKRSSCTVLHGFVSYSAAFEAVALPKPIYADRLSRTNL
jgi:hypothetical protein